MIEAPAPAPAWLNRSMYPFAPHWFQTAAGRLHYVDEGKGRPVVFVHGNPAWSFLFRNVISQLSGTFRCIAPDHLGFGLSDKPRSWSYLPADHAKNLEDLLLGLDLTNITLVVGDWGGPIGLSFALRHPDRINALVITNTWAWSVKNDWYYQGFSKFTGGPIGRALIRKRNFFARDIVKAAFGDKSRLTPEIHEHYLQPLAIPEDRTGCWTFPREIIGSSDWLATLWNRMGMLQHVRVTLAWGMKDVAFRARELNRWLEAFPRATVVRLEDTGHFVTEEHPDAVVRAIRDMNPGI